LKFEVKEASSVAYADFTNLELKQKFGVRQEYRSRIFSHVPPHPVSDWLRSTLERGLPFALAQDSEKARSEYIIAPVFMELREQSGERISVFSGIEFNVDKKLKLTGFCDFLVSRSPYQTALEAPVVVAVEAKRQDFKKGLTQCAVEMVAARIYNEQMGHPVKTIYGCVTIGNVWQFLVLRGDLAEIETTTFDVVEDMEKIVGILLAMALGEVKLSND
jgi:hypothetical protein